jgi:hypothetical protein
MLPRIAFASPPSPPGGGVICMKRLGRSAAAPSHSRTPMIQTSQKSPNKRAIVETVIMTRSCAGGGDRAVVRRRSRARLLALGELQQEQLREREHDRGDEEEDEPSSISAAV